MDTSVAQSGGTNIAGLLGVAFIILKLVGVIAWSWWWVLAPFWIPIVIVVVILIIAGLITGGAAVINALIN